MSIQELAEANLAKLNQVKESHERASKALDQAQQLEGKWALGMLEGRSVSSNEESWRSKEMCKLEKTRHQAISKAE